MALVVNHGSVSTQYGIWRGCLPKSCSCRYQVILGGMQALQCAGTMVIGYCTLVTPIFIVAKCAKRGATARRVCEPISGSWKSMLSVAWEIRNGFVCYH